MKLLDFLFTKWIKLGPLPFPVFALYAFIPAILYMIAILLEWENLGFYHTLGLIGLGLSFVGMVYILLRDRNT